MMRDLPLRAVHAAYRLSLGPARRRFERAAGACEATQHERLRALLRANAASAYGRAHGFGSITSVRDWQDHVPIVGYDALEPWVQRAARGEAGVLTTAPVRLFERTSGSTAANKLVPCTDGLLAEFAAATGPWLHDVYTARPALRGTTSYWSISPATRVGERTEGGIAVGFDDDTEYFGGLARHALRRTLAVPPSVARIAEMDAWAKATALHLAAARDLGLVSVWHPSFFTLLLRHIEQHLDELLPALTPPRAAEIRARLGSCSLAEALWPRLSLVSCWTDGAAGEPAAALRRCVPHAEVQPKGLLATEGVVSFPLFDGTRSHNVAAVAGHFLEFIDLETPAARPRLAHELRPGAAYAPVLSTAGGFYRYRLGDAVRCDGFHVRAPRLRFEGRVDHVSDVCGEKLSAGWVAAALERVQKQTGLSLAFALVAPAAGDPPRYHLYAEGIEAGALDAFVGHLERALSESGGYRYARSLQQLGPLEAVAVRDGAARYIRACAAAGQRPGNVKPSCLDTRSHWHEVFAS